MTEANVVLTISGIWGQMDMERAVLKSLAARIAASGLNDEQVNALLMAHRIEDKFAKRNPDAAKVIERLKGVKNEIAGQRQATASDTPGDGWIHYLRKKYAGFNVADWVVAAGYYEGEHKNARQPIESTERRFTAALYVYHELCGYGANHRQACNAVGWIFRLTAEAVDSESVRRLEAVSEYRRTRKLEVEAMAKEVGK